MLLAVLFNTYSSGNKLPTANNFYALTLHLTNVTFRITDYPVYTFIAIKNVKIIYNT